MEAMRLATVVLGLGLGLCVAPQATAAEGVPIVGLASAGAFAASPARLDVMGPLLGVGAGKADPPESPAAKGEGAPAAVGTLAGILVVLRWVLYAVVVVIVVPLALQRLLRLVPKSGTALVINDLTKRGDHDDRSFVLEKQLAVAVDTLRERISHGPSHLDAGLAEATSFKRPRAPRLDSENAVLDTKVTLGPLSLNPVTLFKALVGLLQRPYAQTVEGWLVEGEDEGSLRLVMESVRSDRSLGADERWESRLSKSRAEVLADAARHLLFVISKPAFTTSRESFVRYCDAMNATDPHVAKEGFQAALRADPSNWMARLELAELLTKQRRPTAAIAHLDQLSRRLEQKTRWCPDAVAKDLGDAVEFSRAIALSMLQIPTQSKKALEILEDLLESKPDDGALRGARAEMWLDLGRADAKRRPEVAQWLEEEYQAIDKCPPADPKQWGDYSRAVAMIASAHAHALLEQGPQHMEKKAKKALYRAIAMMPDFNDPYVTLVRLQMDDKPKKGDEHYANWKEEAEEYLMTALQLDPTSEQAHYHLGKFYSLRRVARYADAKPHLLAAPNIARSHWRLADISHDHDGNLVEALEHLRRSLSLDDSPDQRLASFVQWAQELLATKDDPELREEAKAKARRLAEHGVDERLCKKGTELLEELAQQPKAA